MRFFRRRSTFTLKVENEFKSSGVTVLIKVQGKPVDLPIEFTLSDLKQIDNFDQIQLIDDLVIDEKASRVDIGKYLIPYDEIYDLNEEERYLLNVPEATTPVSIQLDNEGFIGGTSFEFTPKIHTEKYANLHRAGVRKGAIIKLPTGENILLEKEDYELLDSIDDQPPREEMNKLARYIAKVKTKAKSLDISVNEHIERENYEFIDEVDIDVKRTDKGIEFTSTYEHDYLEADVLKEANQSDTGYLQHEGKRIFVDDTAQRTKEKIEHIPHIEPEDIPTFAQNPTAFVPEDIPEDIPLHNFSDRVKKLGIRVYKAQPYVHANENDRGWFDYDTGFAVRDIEGNEIGRETDTFFEDEGEESGYKQVDENTFVEIPDQLEEFQELSKKIKEDTSTDSSSAANKNNYILEIFENITHVEYNQPLFEMKEKIQDEQVFSPNPPSTFKADLYSFQEEGFKWLKSLRLMGNGGLLADDMGLGKTIQVIAYLAYLEEQDRLSPTLLVLPRSLIRNWVNEIKKFAPNIASTENIYIHTGPNRLKDSELISRHSLVFTTYQTLARDQVTMAVIDWEMVICDEAQMIKNPTTANSVAIKALKNNGRIALTGTPVENNLTDLWSIMDFVQPGILGSLTSFRSEYENQSDDEKTYDDIQNSIENKIKYIYMRRTKEGELKDQLPSISDAKFPVGMGREQKRMYEEIVNQAQAKEISGLAAIQRLKMLSSHPGLIDSSMKAIKTNRVPKLTKTLQLINDVKNKNEKVIIFTYYRRMQSILKKEILQEFNIEAPLINGDTDHRQHIIDEFNDSPGFRVLILSPRAAGTGLTITGANHVIHYTRWWNPAVESQATDRVYRIGQERDVKVYYPIVEGEEKGKSVEEIIDRLLDDKKNLAQNVIVPSKGNSIEKEVLGEMSELVH